MGTPALGEPKALHGHRLRGSFRRNAIPAASQDAEWGLDSATTTSSALRPEHNRQCSLSSRLLLLFNIVRF